MLDRDLMAEAIRILADVGLSTADAGRVLGLTRNQVASRARVAGITFSGAYRPGPGCNRAQAAQGWATRRKRDWTWARSVPSVSHVQLRSSDLTT